MPRNPAKPLSPEEYRHQRKIADILKVVTYRDVTLTYRKRDDKPGDPLSSSTGKVAFFNGRIGYDTGSVTIDTADKGPRTINLHRIVRID